MFSRSITLGLAITAVLLTQSTNSVGQTVLHADGIPTMHGEYVDNQPAYGTSTHYNTQASITPGGAAHYPATSSPAYHSGYNSGYTNSGYTNSTPAYTDTPFHTTHTATYNSVYPIDSIPRPIGHPAWNTEDYTLLDYRRLMIKSRAPNPHELQGTWQGINKGIATVAIDKRFIKEFQSVNGQVYGDNVIVMQNGGWQPKLDPQTGAIERQGKFLVQEGPRGFGAFRNGAVLNYRKGGNRTLDPARLISDRVVKLDENHMLGRATAKFGPFEIPLSYFVIQRSTR